MMVTSLAPVLGYETCAKLAKQAFNEEQDDPPARHRAEAAAAGEARRAARSRLDDAAGLNGLILGLAVAGARTNWSLKRPVQTARHRRAMKWASCVDRSGFSCVFDCGDFGTAADTDSTRTTRQTGAVGAAFRLVALLSGLAHHGRELRFRADPTSGCGAGIGGGRATARQGADDSVIEVNDQTSMAVVSASDDGAIDRAAGERGGERAGDSAGRIVSSRPRRREAPVPRGRARFRSWRIRSGRGRCRRSSSTRKWCPRWRRPRNGGILSSPRRPSAAREFRMDRNPGCRGRGRRLAQRRRRMPRRRARRI